MFEFLGKAFSVEFSAINREWSSMERGGLKAALVFPVAFGVRQIERSGRMRGSV